MRVVSENKEQEIGFLEDVDISEGWVSIVTRGANQIPFTIVKSQEPGAEEEVMPGMIARTVIAPKGTPEETLRKVFGEHVKLDNPVETSKDVLYHQLAGQVFDGSSLELFKVADDESGSFKVVAGKLKEKQESGLKLNFLRKKAPVSVLQLAEDMTPEQDVAKSMSYEVYDEISAFNSAVYGVLSQKVGDSSEKLAMVDTLYKNLSAYLAEAFAVMKEKAAEPLEQRPTEEEPTLKTEEETTEETIEESTEETSAEEPAAGTPEEPEADPVVQKLEIGRAHV